MRSRKIKDELMTLRKSDNARACVAAGYMTDEDLEGITRVGKLEMLIHHNAQKMYKNAEDWGGDVCAAKPTNRSLS